MKAKDLIDAGIDEIVEHRLEEQYDEMLDECYPECKVAGYEYPTSKVLAMIDPVAYQCGFADWLSNELEDRIIEIDGKYFERDLVDGYELSLDSKGEAK